MFYTYCLLTDEYSRRTNSVTLCRSSLAKCFLSGGKLRPLLSFIGVIPRMINVDLSGRSAVASCPHTSQNCDVSVRRAALTLSTFPYTIRQFAARGMVWLLNRKSSGSLQGILTSPSVNWLSFYVPLALCSCAGVSVYSCLYKHLGSTFSFSPSTIKAEKMSSNSA